MQRIIIIVCLFALTACGCNKPERVTGSLSSGDVVRITEIVRQDVAKRYGGFERIKTIDETNGAVEVWYADKHVRWGEAGYRLERTTNDWKITIEYFE
jgi:hypothetical protein